MWTFFIILPILYLAGNIYIYLKGKQALKSQSTGVKVLLSIVFWGGALSFFSSFLFRNLDMPASFAQTVSQVGTGWLVFTLYMVLALLVFDILRLFHLRFKYSFYLSLFLTLSLLGYGNYNYQHPDTRVINMVINKPADTDGQSLKVVAISDIHLGYATNKTMLAGYVDMINAQRPDIVLIGGDLIDNSVAPLRYEHMEEELSKIYAPLGVYMVPGNHEYISGIEESEKFIAQTPIVLLRDSVAILISRFGYRYKLVTYTTQSANLMLREIGITLFLACVGISAGDGFVDTIVNNGGFAWIGYGFIITTIPLLIIGCVGRYFYKINYFTLMGLIAGSTTDPPALAYSNATAGNDAPSVGYATVYPLTMFLRVLTAQLLILFFA